ncbi:hypothetical protein ACH5RR_040920 [Cinchona calisaya]|uniref:Uncharacterized protein n=1 Tax=Cinchona calisaya TaxID=153742 RepID=A0ABD2XTM6_9GENT
MVGAIFASGFLRAMKFLEENWQQLCQNIRTGQISDSITDPNCRKAISSILSKPMPDLADAIENEWSMAQYIKTLEFYSGGLPLVSAAYASSEGSFGICLKPLTIVSGQRGPFSSAAQTRLV